MKDNLICIENLSIKYTTDDATIYAVNGLSLNIKEGEMLGLVGETGAGKSTTARSILNLLPDRISKITNGSIKFKGLDITKMGEKEMKNIRGERIAMVFQDPMTSLNPVMKVGDQIGEALLMHKSKDMTKNEIDERVNTLMNMVGLPHERKGEYPHQFSGGMKQRVSIAIALACEPELLLADEPTTALDVTIQAQVLSIIKDLQKKLNTAMLLITHDLGVVAQTCDSVAIMYAGEIVESGSVFDIFEGDKHHPYTRGLFESIPNMEEKTDRLKPIPGLMPDPTKKVEGCPFAERCPNKMDKCEVEKPKAITENNHMIKCFLYESQ